MTSVTLALFGNGSGRNVLVTRCSYHMAKKLVLDCAILGPNVGHVFLVKIPRSDTVALLKDAKPVDLAHVDAGKLRACLVAVLAKAVRAWRGPLKETHVCKDKQ